MTNIFTYGSLMCVDIMFRAAGCKSDYTQATLNNFYRSKMHNLEYPGIIAQTDAVVAGVLYFDLSVKAINRLDLFEGEMYQRQEVEVNLEKQGQATAMTYVIKPQYKHLLTNTEWSFNEFLAIGKEKFEQSYFGFLEL